ncbi:MAG: toxin [PVC group bacterium]
MKYFDWNPDKNEWLRQERGITFEEIIFHLLHEGLLDAMVHPNQKKYPGQRIFIIEVEDYAYIVPFVETNCGVFLKTIIPSSKMTKHYLRGDSNETE